MCPRLSLPKHRLQILAPRIEIGGFVTSFKIEKRNNFRGECELRNKQLRELGSTQCFTCFITRITLQNCYSNTMLFFCGGFKPFQSGSKLQEKLSRAANELEEIFSVLSVFSLCTITLPVV